MIIRYLILAYFMKILIICITDVIQTNAIVIMQEGNNRFNYIVINYFSDEYKPP